MCEATLLNELNIFYAHFDILKESANKSTLPVEDRPLSVMTEDGRKIMLTLNINEAAGPDNILGYELKTCANQLADVITDIFHISLSQANVPPTLRHDYYPVALTPILIECFKKLVLHHIKDNTPARLDHRQYVFRTNRSTEVDKLIALHSVLKYLQKKSCYIRMLLVDFSPAFNTISHIKLIGKPNKQSGLECNSHIISHVNNDESSYWEEINNLPGCAQRTIYCSTSAKPRSLLVIFERRRQRHKPLST